MSRIKRQYYWKAIPHSPFTLVITYPDSYGLNRVKIRNEDEIHRNYVNGYDLLSFFEGHRWRVHPDWYASIEISKINKIKIIFELLFPICLGCIVNMLICILIHQRMN